MDHPTSSYIILLCHTWASRMLLCTEPPRGHSPDLHTAPRTGPTPKLTTLADSMQRAHVRG
eukprot:2877843-Prymnesium_polylepis.1